MKKFMVALTSLVLSMMFVTLLVSCNNDDDDNSNGGSNAAKGLIAGKWVISDSSSPYASFEFTEDGHYIVEGKTGSTTLQSTGTVSKPVKSLSTKPSIKTAGGFLLSVKDDDEDSDSSTGGYYGEYKWVGDKIVSLQGYGTIEITSITDEEIQFSVTLEATGEIYNFVAKKAAPVSTSSKMDLLCNKLWVIQRSECSNLEITDSTDAGIISYQEACGDNWKTQLLEDIASSEITENSSYDRLISKAGTYLKVYHEGGDADLAHWRWADEGETAMDVSWDNWATYHPGSLRITELTSNTLVLQQKVGFSFHDNYEVGNVTLTQYYTYTPSAN